MRMRYSLGLGCGSGTWVGARVEGFGTKEGIRIAFIDGMVFNVSVFEWFVVQVQCLDVDHLIAGLVVLLNLFGLLCRGALATGPQFRYFFREIALLLDSGLILDMMDMERPKTI